MLSKSLTNFSTAGRVRSRTLHPLRFRNQEIDTMLSRLGVALSALGLVTGGLALGTSAQADVRVGVMPTLATFLQRLLTADL